MDSVVSLTLIPIGVFHSDRKYTYDVGRQATSTADSASLQSSYIQLNPKNNFEQALIGLEKGSLIWVIYQFHLNTNWNPMTMPPRGSKTKIGTFATRTPYRPNPIGMSAVRIKSIQGLKIELETTDLVDQTPILDIKPYLSESDAFENEKPTWLQDDPYLVEFSTEALSEISFLENLGLTSLKPFIIQQLTHDPVNSSKKRIEQIEGFGFQIAYRTWRVLFALEEDKVHVHRITSGYSDLELSSAEDIYQDKPLHKAFLAKKT